MLFVNAKCSSLAQIFYLLVHPPPPCSICQMFMQFDVDCRLLFMLNVKGQLSSKLRKYNCFKAVWGMLLFFLLIFLSEFKLNDNVFKKKKQNIKSMQALSSIQYILEQQFRNPSTKLHWFSFENNEVLTSFL